MRCYSKKLLAFTTAAVLWLSGCGRGIKPSAEAVSGASSEQVYPVGSYERRAAELAAAGKDIAGREVIDLGEESIFGGIAVACDGNGELLAEEKEGEIRFRITDRRFRSLSELLRFVRRHAGETEARRLSGCFAERDGTLCFLVGTDGRIIKDIRRNIQCDSQRLTFSITYQNQTRSRNGIIRSDVSFVRKDDIWRLDALTELRAR